MWKVLRQNSENSVIFLHFFCFSFLSFFLLLLLLFLESLECPGAFIAIFSFEEIQREMTEVEGLGKGIFATRNWGPAVSQDLGLLKLSQSLSPIMDGDTHLELSLQAWR